MEKSVGERDTVAGAGHDTRAELAPGTTLGRYEILRLLGRGGMGQVYLARHGLQKTLHALKILPAEFSGRPGFVERFRTELQTMALLQHPNVVHAQYSDVERGVYYLVMDFVAADGSEEPYDLEEALADEKRLGSKTGRRLMLQVCDGLMHAHGQGVIHRDLKPANVLLTSKDLAVADIKICDFGLARVIGEEQVHALIKESVRKSISMGEKSTFVERKRSERSSTGSVLGTYGYMSPEQEEGRPADARSDIYALGVMMYRMLTGQRLRGLAKPASHAAPWIESTWDHIIGKCLETNPDARFQTVEKLRRSLDEFADNSVMSEDNVRENDDKPRTKVITRKAIKVAVASLMLVVLWIASKQRADLGRQVVATWSCVVHNARLLKGKASAGGKSIQTAGVDMGRNRKATRLSYDTEVDATSKLTFQKGEKTTKSEVAVIGARAPVAGSNIRINDLGLELVWVAPGDFSKFSVSGLQEVSPARTSRLTRGYWIGKTEVSQAQWMSLMGDRPSHFKGEDLPVESVSWGQCVAFCKILHDRESSSGWLPEGYMYRLPTEVEWEYAARGGVNSRGFTFSGGNELGVLGWFEGNSGKMTHPVGLKTANELGIHDMSGNVWEWCLDCYQGSPRDYLDISAPSASNMSASRVVRGGGFEFEASVCRSAFRTDVNPLDLDKSLGFRVVLAPVP